MRVNKFVLDANIWLSYFITQQEQHLASIIFDNELIIFSCIELLHEIKRVSTYQHLEKYKLRWNSIKEFIQLSTVQFDLTYPIKNYIPQDEDDNYIIALALQTNSGFITSGDQHILSQKKALSRKFKKLEIISKAEFERRFQKSVK
jgi:putative PIN family toxin of toxin-antitoxin system